MASKFSHLHLHTEYSLLDGLSKIDKLVDHIKENDMDSLAITDHGVMYGAIEFYKKAKKAGVKPIIGMEAYTTNINMEERPERGKFKNFHLLLLAKDIEGYKNLMKITSEAHLRGFYYKPRVDHETLAKYSKGLICTSACAQGELAQALIAKDNSEVKKVVKWYGEVFGKDYYLEIQRHHYDEASKKNENQELKRELLEMSENEKIINDGVVKISREMGIPIIATNDAHYIKKEDAVAQDALVCVATGKNVSDIKRLRFIDSPNFYVTTPTQMQELFSDLPDSIENTIKVADKCEIELTLDKWFFPKYKLEGKASEDEEMEKRTWEGIKGRVKEVTPEVKERLEYELGIIKEKGYATYFLIVADMARWASDNGIVTNTRGSAAGSLVSFALGIINLNPLDYGLPFERFLTPWRPSPPDIDFDIADDRKEDVVDYLIKKYGEDKVAQICTFGRMMAKAAVRDIARVLGYPYATGDRISKAIPIGSQGFPMSIEKALEISPELSTLYKNDADAKKIIDLARGVEGNARHVSVHAAGVVIAPEPLTNFTPIQKEGDRLITQYDMEALDPNVSPEAVGLLKFDLLGLRNLSILGAAIKIIKETRSEEIDLITIPLTNKKTFEMLSRGETMGVFQLSSSGMTKWIKELKPTRIEDLMAMVALYRPGPMQFIPEYIKCKRDPSTVKYIDPRMKEYMGMSYGLLIYQEDVLLSAINLAGYSWEEADKFRKAIGKKIPAEMEKQHGKFVSGCISNGMTEKKAEALFLMIEKFAAYGFNKGHSASYGRVAYWTAYLKANYPVEYMAALLTAESGDNEKISEAINECRRMEIKVSPPDINNSQVAFKIDGVEIRFGLSAIKNVGKAAIEAILESRQKGNFVSFADFLSRVDARRVNKKVLESLIKVGAMSAFGGRASLLSSMDELRGRIKSTVDPQQGLFSAKEDEKVKFSTDIVLNEIPEFSDEELQSLERQLLGLSLSAKPLSELLGPLSGFGTHKISELTIDFPKSEMVKIAGVVTAVRVVVTKRSAQEMAFVKLQDETGIIDLVVFPRLYASTRNFWVDNTPFLIEGRVDAKEESPSILVESIKTKPTDTLFVKIPQDIESVKLKNLKELLLSYPGEQQVSLVFEGTDQTITLPFTITWSEGLSRLISDVLEGTPYSGVE
ncbi:MAG: DNA polymerase III subunit alpha [Patescibacteria group bacterium]